MTDFEFKSERWNLIGEVSLSYRKDGKYCQSKDSYKVYKIENYLEVKKRSLEEAENIKKFLKNWVRNGVVLD